MLVSRRPGLSPLVSWPCVMADSASRACDAALLACCGFDPSRPHRCLTAHAGIRAQVDSDQSGKCQSPPAAGCQAVTRVERGFSGRRRGRYPRGHTSSHCRPKWKHRPAASAETGDARGPRSYDLSRFDGQVESAEAFMAFRLTRGAVRLRVATCPRIPAVRGGSLEKGLPVVIRLSPRGAMVPCLR